MHLNVKYLDNQLLGRQCASCVSRLGYKYTRPQTHNMPCVQDSNFRARTFLSRITNCSLPRNVTDEGSSSICMYSVTPSGDMDAVNVQGHLQQEQLNLKKRKISHRSCSATLTASVKEMDNRIASKLWISSASQQNYTLVKHNEYTRDGHFVSPGQGGSAFENMEDLWNSSRDREASVDSPLF